jgi:hypothetical protein
MKALALLIISFFAMTFMANAQDIATMATDPTNPLWSTAYPKADDSKPLGEHPASLIRELQSWLRSKIFLNSNIDVISFPQTTSFGRAVRNIRYEPFGQGIRELYLRDKSNGEEIFCELFLDYNIQILSIDYCADSSGKLNIPKRKLKF